MEKALTYLVIGLGSAIGGVGRHWVATHVAQRWGETLPWGTILVNISGSFAIGLLAAISVTNGATRWSPTTTHFLLAGICGGYTTFSAFSLQTLRLLQAGNWPHAGFNILFSVLACITAVWLGYLAGQLVQR